MSVELSVWGKDAVQVAYRHSQDLQTQRDARIAAEMGNDCR